MRQSSVEKKSFPGLKPELLLKLFLIILFLYTCYNLFLSQYSIFKVFELEKSSRKVRAQVEYYSRENRKKEQLLELVKEHPEYFKEKFAREYMQMQKKDEYILILKD